MFTASYFWSLFANENLAVMHVVMFQQRSCDTCAMLGLMEIVWVTDMWGGSLMLPSSVRKGSIKQRQPCVMYATVIAQQRRQSAFAR